MTQMSFGWRAASVENNGPVKWDGRSETDSSLINLGWALPFHGP